MNKFFLKLIWGLFKLSKMYLLSLKFYPVSKLTLPKVLSLVLKFIEMIS
jgi:hypothetical protein